MKILPLSLKELFRPLAAALSAAALAIPLVTASAPAEARVMDHGPTSLVFNQLAKDGYTPVGAGYSDFDNGKAVLLSIFQNDKADWIATSGNDKTMQVVARGKDLKISDWVIGTEVSYEQPRLIQQQGQNCGPLDALRERMLKKVFPTGQLIEGTMDGGDTMQAYVSKENWVVLSVHKNPNDPADQTACMQDGGIGFSFAAPMTALVPTH